MRNPGVTTDHDGFFPPLYFAAQQTRFPELVSLLLEANADVNIAMIHIEGESYTFHGATPLHQAVYNGSIRTVKALLAAGAAVDVRRGPKRQTELHEAASCGRRGYPIGGWRPNGGGPIGLQRGRRRRWRSPHRPTTEARGQGGVRMMLAVVFFSALCVGHFVNCVF